MTTAIAKKHEEAPVENEQQALQITKGDVKRIVNYAVEETRQAVMKIGGQPGSNLTPEALQFYAAMIRSAGLIPQSSREDRAVLENRAMAKIIAGDYFGFDPISSQTLIHYLPVNGTLQVSAEGRAALIKSSGRYDYQIMEHDKEKCIARFYEKAIAVTS